MSLDVTLVGGTKEVDCTCSECFNTHSKLQREILFDSNITHNLGEMAEAAGIYKHCWRPEELGIIKAEELIGPLQKGLDALKSDRVRFEKYNSPNGWGSYENFVPWVEEYLNACKRHPRAFIEASR